MPNITGSFSFATAGQERRGTQAFSSSFYKRVDSGISAGTYFSDDGLGVLSFSFSASNGETKTDGTVKTDDEYKVYGSSDHVTPFNLSIKVWQRIS